MNNEKLVGKFVELFTYEGRQTIGLVTDIGNTGAEANVKFSFGDELWDQTDWFAIDELTPIKRPAHLRSIGLGNFTCIVDLKKKTLYVGCQQIKFSTIRKLNKLIQ